MAGRGQPRYTTRRGASSSSSSSAPPPRKFHSNSHRNVKPSTSHISIQETPHNFKNNNPNSKGYKGPDIDEDDVRNLPSLVGTCPFMCPVEERETRERLRDLAVFERLNGDTSKSSPSLAVKKFCRTISIKNVQTFDLRPLPVLEQTLDYLFNLLHSTKRPFEVVHDFLFDRTRSIRQDLSMQNCSGDRVISMYERMVKFHIMSHHELRRCSDPNISSMLHLNMEQLKKALTTLFDLYEANRTSQFIHKNETEFHACYVLLHLRSECQGDSLCLWFRQVPLKIMKSKEMCFARRMLRYFRLGNYKRFIHTAESDASYLQYCIIEPYISEVRELAISSLNHGGYKLQPFPLADLSKLLMMKEWDMESFFRDYGLQILTDEEGNRCLFSKQTLRVSPKDTLQKCYPLDSERFERYFFHGILFTPPPISQTLPPRFPQPLLIQQHQGFQV
nr:SAC3 family protein C isoform X1 [Ipomoea batatas]